MAGKFGPASVVVLAGGYNLLAAKLKSLNHKIESITEPTGGLGDASEEATPVGVERLTVTQGGGFFDTSTAKTHAAWSAGMGTTPQATPKVICVGFAGNEIGAPFYGIQGMFQVDYEVMAAIAELTKANAQYRVAGRLDRGQIIQHLTAKTADWNTKTLGTQVDYAADTQQRVIPITSNSVANPSVVTTPVPHGLTTGDIIVISGVSTSSPTINGQRTVTVISETTFSVPVNVTVGGTGGSFVKANSANGGVGYLQVTAASGFTNFVGKIRDSADDTTYADLVTFTDNVSAPFAERVSVAGVCDRYLSFDGNVTGSGEITVFAGFCRS